MKPWDLSLRNAPPPAPQHLKETEQQEAVLTQRDKERDTHTGQGRADMGWLKLGRPLPALEMILHRSGRAQA